jgi:general secretion pathway protein L
VKHDYVIVLPRERETPPVWYRVAQDRIVRRGRGTEWLPPEDADEPEESVGRALLVLPPHVTTLHWIACPGMTPRQGAAAARLMALESSIGEADQLHAAVSANDDPDAPHVVAVTSRSAMAHWTEWAASHGIAQASFVPSAMLLPQPEDGYVRAPIGGVDVVRGRETAFDGGEPYADILIGEAQVTRMPPETVDDALVMALEAPPIDLRQGEYARRAPAIFDASRRRRMLVMIGLILLASLIISLVKIVRLNVEASRLDDQTVALAKTVDPSVQDPLTAETRTTVMLASRGGRGGFTGMMAGLMSAMQANANVTLNSVSQSADGTLRVQLAATDANEINDVLIAIQEAGWRIGANAVQQRGAQLVADITVVR